MPHPTHHRTIDIDGVELFYREAGPHDAPVVLALHGFPASSRMFRNLMPALGDGFRVIAPDYPGFGHSALPSPSTFACSFDGYAHLVRALLAALGVDRFAIYVHDFGAPVGFRLATAHPDRISALIVQNGNAYEEGLGPFFAPLFAHWRSPGAETREALRGVLTRDAVRWQYLEGVVDPARVDPDNWLVDHALLARSGVEEVMLGLFEDYHTNLLQYPTIHAFFRQWRPPTLIVWGAGDPIFTVEGARAYLRDLPDAELHLLESGHFALEDMGAEITALVRAFLLRKLAPGGRTRAAATLRRASRH